MTRPANTTDAVVFTDVYGDTLTVHPDAACVLLTSCTSDGDTQILLPLEEAERLHVVLGHVLAHLNGETR